MAGYLCSTIFRGTRKDLLGSLSGKTRYVTDVLPRRQKGIDFSTQFIDLVCLKIDASVTATNMFRILAEFVINAFCEDNVTTKH